MLAPGTVIDGRYRIEAEIGSGGFATVYAGHHLTLNAPVAIKVLRLYAEDSHERRDALLSSFVEEARLVMRLRHDNVVRTLDQGVHRGENTGFGLPYVVLEWCGYESLGTWLESHRGAPMPLADAYPLIDAITAGMAHAHELGVAHRDLKPSNVMLARDARGTVVPRIIDFGIAKLFEANQFAGGTQTTSDGARKYTPAYAAPEQLGGLASGPWTDVHAIGLLFVELLSGCLPYDRSALGPIDPNRPTPKTFGIDVGAFEPVIARAVSFDPRHRYAHAGELLVALREAATRSEMERAPTVVAAVSPFASTPPVRPSTSTHGALANTVRHEPRSLLWLPLVLMSGVAVLALAIVLGVMRKPKAPAPIERSTHQLATRGMRSLPARIDHLSDLIQSDLERRLRDAGLQITGRGEDPDQTYLHFSSGNESGTAYLNHISDVGDLPSQTRALATLPTINGWIEYDRSLGLELAYGVEGDRVLSVTGKSKQFTLELFEKLAKGFTFEIRGSSFGHPDPATQREDAKQLWRAKSLDDIEVAELMSRLSIAGARVSEIRLGTSWVSLSFVAAKHRGEIHLVKSDDHAAEELIKNVRRAGVPFTRARQDTGRIVIQGSGELGTRKFLSKVLEGLDVSFE